MAKEVIRGDRSLDDALVAVKEEQTRANGVEAIRGSTLSLAVQPNIPTAVSAVAPAGDLLRAKSGAELPFFVTLLIG